MRPADARLAASPGLDPAALDRLRGSTVATIGLGVLGGAFIQHLALLGVRQVGIDCGEVEPVNLANQGLPASSVGDAKSVVRARQVAAMNPDCVVHPITARIENLGLGALAQVDLLVTALDGRAARARVNEIAVMLGRRWLDLAVDGSGRSLHGTVTFYDLRRSDSACYVCGRDATALATIAREGRGPGCPSWRGRDAVVTPPTLQTSAFGAVVAGFAATWATRILLGRADDLVNRELVVDGDREPRLRVLSRTPNDRCLFPHRRLEPLLSTNAATVGELLAVAAAALGAEPDTLVFPGRTLALGLACPACSATRPLVRAVTAFTDEQVRCGRCNHEMVPLALSEQLTKEETRRCADLGWGDLGLPAAEVVTATAGKSVASFIVNGRAYA